MSRHLHATTPGALDEAAALGCNARLPAWTAAANAGPTPAGARLRPVVCWSPSPPAAGSPRPRLFFRLRL
eukprot:956536-Alexandrium_andersonii.AAC.1